MVNLYGRFRTARANLSVSRSIGGLFCGNGAAAVGAPQIAHLLSPAPTIAPQLRHNVGRPGLVWLDPLSDNTQRLTSVMLNVQSITLRNEPPDLTSLRQTAQRTYQNRLAA